MRRDEDKTKEQLINELAEMRQRVTELETLETRRKRMEEALAEERNLLRTLIDNLPDLIYVKDTESRFVIGNIAVGHLMGATTPDDLVGKTDFDFYPQELAAQYYADEQEIIRAGQPLINREEPLMAQMSDRRGWLLTTKVPLRDINDEIVGLVGIGRDITERKRAEEALRKSEEKYRDLVENINDIIYATDSDGVVTYISPVIESLSGYSPSEIVGRTFSEFVYREDLPLLVKKTRRALSGHAEANEYRYLTRSGEIRWMRTSSQPVFMGDRVIGLRGVLTDVTERKALEEMWRRYEFIVNTSGEFMTLVSNNYVYEAVNESYCKAHNKTRQDIIGRTVADVWDEELFNTVIKAHLDKCFAGNEVHEQAWFEFAALGQRYMDVAYYPYYGDNEETITHAVVISRDITRLRRAEEELRKLSQFRESVIDNVNVWLDVLDEKANILVWNKAAEEISGYSRHEVVGHDKVWEWLYPDEEYRSEIMRGAIESIEREDFETVIRCKDGQTRIISWNTRRLVDEKGVRVGTIAVGRDITERRPVEERREKPAEVEAGGLITMCASCKKLRDDEGHWHPIEAYILERCPVRISHGICPDCAKELYPDFFKGDE